MPLTLVRSRFADEVRQAVAEALIPAVYRRAVDEARIRPVTICYRCDAEYRDVPVNPHHKGYDPHVAERYAERKTLRRMR